MVTSIFLSKGVTNYATHSKLEVDYDDSPPRLFLEIENKAWDPVCTFLETSSWPISSASIFPDGYGPERATKTWVTKYDRKELGEPFWSQLPIHAALVMEAPTRVVKLLLKWHPQSARCVDDCQMLPIHLAMAHNATDEVIALLLKEFPKGINEKCDQGFSPLDYALKCKQSPHRALIFSSLISHLQRCYDVEKKEQEIVLLESKLRTQEREPKMQDSPEYKKQHEIFLHEKQKIKMFIQTKMTKKSTQKSYESLLEELSRTKFDQRDTTSNELKSIKERSELIDVKFRTRKDIHDLIKYTQTQLEQPTGHKTNQLMEAKTLLVETDMTLDRMNKTEVETLLKKMNSLKRDLKQVDLERLKEKLKKQLIEKSGSEEKSWIKAISSIPDNRLGSMNYNQLGEIKRKVDHILKPRPKSPLRRLRNALERERKDVHHESESHATESYSSESSETSNGRNPPFVIRSTEHGQEAMLEGPLASF